MRLFSKKEVLFLICGLLVQTARAQPAHTPPKVSESDIFAALTDQDRPAELAALRRLRDTLGGAPNAQTLQAAQAQLDQVLQADEKRDGDMPPALVMSGIASRIERAMAGLEAAQRAPGAQPAWLVPALAALAAGMGVALAACLAGMASRGREAEAAEELNDTLKKIRRKLEGASPVGAAGAVRAHDLVHELAEAASDEASEAVNQATHAVERLANATRDAEGRLQASVEAAELRLRGAAAISGQLHHWMQALPDRLAQAVQAMQAGGLPAVEAAAARLEESVTPLAALPSLLVAYRGSASPPSAEAEARLASLHGRIEAGAARIESLTRALPETIADAVRTGSAAGLSAALGELASGADLLTELGSLSFGQTARLEDLVGRMDQAVHGAMQVTERLDAATGQLRGQTERNAVSAERARDAASEMRREAASLCQAAAVLAQAAPQPAAHSVGLENVLTAVRSACERLDADLSLMSQSRQALTQDAAFIGHEARRTQAGATAAQAALAAAIATVQRAAVGLQTSLQAGAEAQEAAIVRASRAAAELMHLNGSGSLTDRLRDEA